MRTITLSALDDNPSLVDDIAAILRRDGLVCFPTRRQYSLAASLYSAEAVLRLVQSKRRSTKAPSLVLVPDRRALRALAADVPPVAEALTRRFWPGPLTLLVRPGDKVPGKVIKTLGLKKGRRLGVRFCESDPACRITKAFGGPLLISSANIAKKVGSSSVAKIRKIFHHSVELLVDAGDVPAATPSTVVDPDDKAPTRVTREGIIPAAHVVEALVAAGLQG